jgi:hypothetical protein
MSGATPAKKKMGRPRVGSIQASIMLQPGLLTRLDAWIARQPEPRPSRPEALRRLATMALDQVDEDR